MRQDTDKRKNRVLTFTGFIFLVCAGACEAVCCIKNLPAEAAWIIFALTVFFIGAGLWCIIVDHESRKEEKERLI